MLNYSNAISLNKEPKRPIENSNLEWLKWLITAIAIVGSFATGGLSLKASIAVNTAISVAETAFYLGIDIHQKQEINPLNLGIEVLATIIPIPIAYKSGKRAVRVLKKQAAKYETITRRFLSYKTTPYHSTKFIKKGAIIKRPFGRFKTLSFSSHDIHWNMPFKVVKKYQKELNKAFQHPTIKRILRKVNNIEIDAAIARWGGLTTNDRILLKSGISSLIKRRQMTEQNMKGILKSLSPNGRKVLLNNFEESLKLRKFKPRSLTTRTTARSYLKYLGSKRFNDKIVQRAQYIDKVDFGRAPIEFIYRKLVKYWNYVLKNGWKNTYKIAFKNSKKALMLEKNYKRYQRVNYKRPFRFRSRYLKSMRVLHGWNNLGRDPMVCIMNFVKYPIKYGKNAGGKKPVIFLATKKEFKILANEGSVYWWRKQNQFKGWWYSRGGKPYFLTFGGGSQYVGFLVSALPFQAIKFVSSIISNWVEAMYKIGAGEWSWSEYWEGYWKSFKRMGVKRTGRFIGKDLIGRSIAKRLHSPFAKEIARRVAWGFGTLLTETFEASQKKFKKRGSYSSQELSKIFLDKAQKQFRSKTITLMRSKVRRFSGQALNPFLGKKTAGRKLRITRALRSTLIKGRAKNYKFKL